jgi:hypothetical protein
MVSHSVPLIGGKYSGFETGGAGSSILLLFLHEAIRINPVNTKSRVLGFIVLEI